MKRLAIKLVVFLLLGAVVNVVVAWASACAIPRPKPNTFTFPGLYPPNASDVRWWEVRRPDGVEDSPDGIERKTGLGWSQSTIFGGGTVLPGDNGGLRLSDDASTIEASRIVIRFAPGAEQQQKALEVGRLTIAKRFQAGLPLRCFSGSMWHQSDADGLRPIANEIQNLWVSDSTEARRFGSWTSLLPVGPVWIGLIINTLFYTALLWLPFAPFSARRLIRKRSGRCVKCGYNLTGTKHEVCPECGA